MVGSDVSRCRDNRQLHPLYIHEGHKRNGLRLRSFGLWERNKIRKQHSLLGKGEKDQRMPQKDQRIPRKYQGNVKPKPSENRGQAKGLEIVKDCKRSRAGKLTPSKHQKKPTPSKNQGWAKPMDWKWSRDQGDVNDQRRAKTKGKQKPVRSKNQRQAKTNAKQNPTRSKNQGIGEDQGSVKDQGM